MTHAQTSPVKRETSASYRRRALIVEVTAHAAVIREKGRRDRVVCPWDAIYQMGMKLRARETTARKKGKKQ
jgi:hypothetical protein